MEPSCETNGGYGYEANGTTRTIVGNTKNDDDDVQALKHVRTYIYTCFDWTNIRMIGTYVQGFAKRLIAPFLSIYDQGT